MGISTALWKKHVSAFTLVEVLVSLFMFTILMAAISQIFVAAFTRYEDARSVQWNLERAQFVMNTLAKELRTSTVVSSEGSQDTVQFFDYSQNACLRYRISGTWLEVARRDSSDLNDCQSNNPSSFKSLVNGVSGKFEVTRSDGSSDPKVVGKVTISFEVRNGATAATEGSANPSHRAYIQTTVSLRDYGNVGLLDYLNP